MKPKKDGGELTLTVEEAAAVLGISRGVAYNAVKNGQLPSLRFGKRIVIPAAAIYRMLGVDGGR